MSRLHEEVEVRNLIRVLDHVPVFTVNVCVGVGAAVTPGYILIIIKQMSEDFLHYYVCKTLVLPYRTVLYNVKSWEILICVCTHHVHEAYSVLLVVI